MNPLDADASLLMFEIGPVATLIERSRTVRDLWSGSFISSWLMAAAMEPVRDKLISPNTEGNPVAEAFRKIFDPKKKESRSTPCLPDVFIALVERGDANALAEKCVKSCQDEWEKIADKVRSVLIDQGLFSAADLDWDGLWGRQLKSFLNLNTVVLPLTDCTPERLSELGISQGGWPEGRLLLSLMQARQSVAYTPAYSPVPNENGRFAPKCSLLGSYEQLGPADLDASRKWWEQRAERPIDGTRLTKADRFCAISLLKRFAWSAYFRERLKLSLDDLRYSDTATAAARVWLAEGEALSPEKIRGAFHDWSGHWLHWNRRDEDKEDPCPEEIWNVIWPVIQRKRKAQGRAPTYYAILVMDGDNVTKLRMDERPRDNWGTGSDRQRDISSKMNKFALGAQEIVETGHKGELVFAGGDDTLALLPARSALGCAQALADRYKEGLRGETVSAGVAVIHMKEDLRFALRMARESAAAVKQEFDKAAINLTVCRRSGERASAAFGWKQVPRLVDLTEFFLHGVSDRWTYKYRHESETLRALPRHAQTAELGRLLSRIEGVALEEREVFRNLVVSFHQDYHEEIANRPARPGADPLMDFVTLCQSASFLARGRDE